MRFCEYLVISRWSSDLGCNLRTIEISMHLLRSTCMKRSSGTLQFELVLRQVAKWSAKC